MLYDTYLPSNSQSGRGTNRGQFDEALAFGLASSAQTSAAPGLGSFNPVVAMMAIDELRREVSMADLNKFMAPLRRLVGRLASTKPAHRLDEKLGINLPLSDNAFGEMMEEVRRYKWLEAERAGRDIWSERSRQDPEAAAFLEWFRKYYGEWYFSRQTHRKMAQTLVTAR